MTTHNVEVNVTANTQQAQKSLSYLQNLMGEFGKQATNRFAAMLGAAAVAKMAFDKVSQSISANIATAKQVSQMAIKFNIDPVAMHSITMAAKDAGVSVRALTMSMKQLGKYAEKAMSSKEAQANFKQLGIEANKLNEIQASPSKFLPEIAKALMEIGDENQRSAAGATLLGRQYQMLLPLIEELGSSEEARAKFLENENAMTAEQIAANKEIAKLQNDLSDGFDKMVASVAPLLLWAMNFINYLAQGVGFIKDMIFESDKAKKERQTSESSAVVNRIKGYQEILIAKKESGDLTAGEKEGIEKAGGVEAYVAQQVARLDKQQKLIARKKEALENFEHLGTATKEEAGGKTLDDEIKEAGEGISEDFKLLLGVHDSQKGGGKFFADNDKLKYKKSLSEVASASSLGDLKRIETEGIDVTRKSANAAEAKAAEEKYKYDLGNYNKLRRTHAALSGRIYDVATNKDYGKVEYARLLESRGESKDNIGLKIRSFEKEEDRIKREKQMKASEEKLASSERKLYVGSKEGGKYKQGLDEAEKAAEALEDAKRAQDAPLRDLRDQQKIYSDLASDFYDAQFGDPNSEVDNSEEILRLTAQMEVEKVKLNDLQSKANDLKGQEIAAEENLKKAMEKTYREEEKRKDAVKARIKTEQDHEKQLKYKVMKAEGLSQRDITQEQLKDEEAEYGTMLKDYSERLAELKGNQFKGNKGEDISEEERKELEGLTKELDAKKRGILDKAFEFGNQGDKGQVTSMRRIGGGGMEYGGLANTAKESLEVQKKMLKELEGKNGVNLFPTLYENATGVYRDASKYGKTYADSYTGADGSPR